MANLNLPTTMKAWQYSSTKGGLPKNLTLNHKAPVPKPKQDQHLVKIKAVSINPVDYKPAEVQFVHRLMFEKPSTPCIDFVGEVVKPASTSTFKPGHLIFGVAKNPFAGGMLAEYAIVENDGAVALATSMTENDGASIGVAALTALQSMENRVRPNSRIFINGGSGGTGIYGIQIAKALGHDVTVTCSSRNVELCQSLGADVIDYTQGSVVEALNKRAQTKRYDLVIDNVFSDSKLYWRSAEYTASKASYLVIAGSPTLYFITEMMKMRLIPGFLGGGKRKIDSLMCKPNVEGLRQVRTWYTEKKVKSVIDQVFPFENAVQAFEKSKTGRAVGKIIIDVEGSAK